MKPMISVRNLGKQYRIGARREPYRTLRETLTDAARAPLDWLRGRRSETTDAIWALKDVSFDVQPGEVVGIIGRNGAGKSTLLKVLSRITEPTEGEIHLHGRVGSLLEVGTGFHPELTGRENIFLAGAILGMKRAEITRKFDEIVAFAGIDQFLDTPVKRYSSGMYMRLAFAVAAHLETEILLVDEVLAVGDAEFQKKCLGKMGEVARQGRTVLFVSHNMPGIKVLCSRAIQLSLGRLSRDADTSSVIADYFATETAGSFPERVWPDIPRSPGNDLIRLQALRVLDSSGTLHATYSTSKPLFVEMEFILTALDSRLRVGFSLIGGNHTVVFQSCHNDAAPDHWPKLRIGHNRLICPIPPGLLAFGTYHIAPQAYLYCAEWILAGNPEVSFNLTLDHGVSPFWATVHNVHFPGVIAPVLQWQEGRKCEAPTEA